MANVQDKIDPSITGDNGDHIEAASGPVLAVQHIDYLIQRHGTAKLNPIPSACDIDPYNWTSWKVCLLF